MFTWGSSLLLLTSWFQSINSQVIQGDFSNTPTNWNSIKTANDSLAQNIVGCEYIFGLPTKNKTVSFRSGFSVKKFSSSMKEMKAYHSLQPSLSHANKEFTNDINAHGFGYDSFGQETETRWVVQQDHPSQHRNTCISASFKLNYSNPVDLYSQYKRVSYRPSYLLYKQHAVIHPTGAVLSNCGYFQGYEGCETQHVDLWQTVLQKCEESYGSNVNDLVNHLFVKNISSVIDQHKSEMAYKTLESCMSQQKGLSNETNPLNSVTHKPRVFVITAFGDFNFYHFIVDSLSRLSRHLTFLKNNPDIFIHIRGFEHDDLEQVRSKEFKDQAVKMRSDLMTILGLSPSRLVMGIVVADEVFIPRSINCGFALANSHELRLIGKQLLAGARKLCPAKETTLHAHPNYFSKFFRKKKNMVILQRYQITTSDRQWNNETYDTVVKDFHQIFPDHNVIRHSSLDVFKPGFSLACNIVEYASADILVGMHGAGLTNMLFMPPGALVVEVIGYVQDIHMTICGYYGPLTATMGHHHYMFAYDEYELEMFRSDSAAIETKKMYDIIHNLK